MSVERIDMHEKLVKDAKKKMEFEKKWGKVARLALLGAIGICAAAMILLIVVEDTFIRRFAHSMYLVIIFMSVSGLCRLDVRIRRREKLYDTILDSLQLIMEDEKTKDGKGKEGSEPLVQALVKLEGDGEQSGEIEVADANAGKQGDIGKSHVGKWKGLGSTNAPSGSRGYKN